MKRSCSSLKFKDQVIFNIYSSIYEHKIPEIGTVLDVNKERREVIVDWLEGYKDRHDNIPYEDMLAIYNPNGEMMHFDNISGPSDILVPDDIVKEEEEEKDL